MSGLFLLDTNILSEPLRPQPDPQAMALLQEHQGGLVTASVVWHEMLFGCWRLPESARRTAIERYLFDVVRTGLPIFEYDHRAAAWHAAERARLSAAGLTPAFADGQIAAIAAVNGCTLATGNPADFENFNLEVQNWRSLRA